MRSFCLEYNFLNISPNLRSFPPVGQGFTQVLSVHSAMRRASMLWGKTTKIVCGCHFSSFRHGVSCREWYCLLNDYSRWPSMVNLVPLCPCLGWGRYPIDDGTLLLFFGEDPNFLFHFSRKIHIVIGNNVDWGVLLVCTIQGMRHVGLCFYLWEKIVIYLENHYVSELAKFMLKVQLPVFNSVFNVCIHSWHFILLR